MVTKTNVSTEASATVHMMGTDHQYDSNVVKATVNAIVQSGKQGAGLLAAIVTAIRSCKDMDTAVGMFAFSERQACKREGVNTLGALAAKYSLKQLSYVPTKSLVMKSADENTAQLKTAWVEWAKFDHEHNAVDLREMPKGFLDIFSERYTATDKEQSSTKFMRDVRECEEAGSLLLQGKRQAEVAARKAVTTNQGNGTVTPAPAPSQTAQGMRSGGGTGEPDAMNADLAETNAAIGRLILQAQDLVPISVLKQKLNSYLVDLAKTVDSARKAKEAKASAEGRKQRPSKAVAEAAKLPDLDDADLKNIEEVEKQSDRKVG